MWLSDWRAKRREEAKWFIIGKELQVMHLLWTEGTDLSVYGIQQVMHRDYSNVYDSATIESQFFSLEKKGFVSIYFQDCLPWAHSLVSQDEFIERIRQKEREENERFEKYCPFARMGRKQREWTEEDQEKLEKLIASLSDGDDDQRKTKSAGHDR